MRAVLVFVMFLVFAGAAQGQIINVKLQINNVDNMVYIPGTGEVPADSLGSGTVYSAEHFYIASYLNNLMYALVGSSGTTLFAGNDANSHNITLNQNLDGSRVLLGFTKGDWNNIDSVISSIEDGSFFKEFSPSLSFGIGPYQVVKVLLAYYSINITGNVRLHSGLRKIIVSNEGHMNGVPRVRISST